MDAAETLTAIALDLERLRFWFAWGGLQVLMVLLAASGRLPTDTRFDRWLSFITMAACTIAINLLVLSWVGGYPK